MREMRPTIVDRLTKGLHERFDKVANDPLPAWWVDLIHQLNAEEGDAADDSRLSRIVLRLGPPHRSDGG
jgi:hypothetical protein